MQQGVRGIPRAAASNHEPKGLDMDVSKVAIIVNSDQVFEDSLHLATVGGETFLEFLLGNVRSAVPGGRKIFAMAFRDLQQMSERLVNLVESFGFEMFIGDRDYANRLARAARLAGFEHVLDIDATCPLTSLHFVEEMLSAHLSSGRDLTVCHNLPRPLAPTIVRRAALGLCNSLVNTSMPKAFGLDGTLRPGATYQDFMLANPGHFSANLFEAPVRWEGAAFDPFAEELSALRLDVKENLPRIRDAIYTIGKHSLTSDDVIDVLLIRNMQKNWDRLEEFDTKYAVVDGANMSTDEEFEKATQYEINWFVLKDEKFLGQADLSTKSILELGCGHARLLRFLAPVFREVHGTDASSHRIREGGYRLRDFPNAHVSQADGRSLRQYADATFDYAFAHGVFVHIHSKSIIDSYIKEMARVVKPGGRIKFDIYHGRDVFGIGPRFFGIGARYTEDEIAEVFKEAGLKLLDISYISPRQYAREARSGKERSGLPLKQMLVVAEK